MSEQPPAHIARLIPRLELTGTERILELGAAPGVAVAEIGPILSGDGHVTALDRSAVGARRIRERNQALVDAGRVSVVEQDLTTLAPEPPSRFDLIFASNVNVFWTHPRKANVDALAALLAPGGRLRLFYGYGPGDGAGSGRDTGSLVAATLRAAAGLADVTIDGAGPTLQVSARKRD
ncbi:class I SAM-dependent methyltransferase [Jiangella alkaliphila]|uniref:Methyltransferase domain-containing protein n=1 Tax=Jiangella alkaliphila TaxID=419479 RepID=A0A1H2LNZ7_9ACTN|nr:class I SAM-dependent methyltransferase [Jiangella alkaliphila]SDU82737.1 Methyltransferase domain-containing protein [Jiangella alkaliphila]